MMPQEAVLRLLTISLVLVAGCDASDVSLCENPLSDPLAEPTQQATADLDCDGVAERVTIEHMEHDRLFLPQITVRSETFNSRVAMAWDGLPQISQVGDLVGDSILDVLMVDSDIGVTNALAALIHRDTILTLSYGDVETARAMNFIYDEALGKACSDVGRPFLTITEPHGVVISVAHGHVSGGKPCSSVDRRLFVSVGQVLQAVDP